MEQRDRIREEAMRALDNVVAVHLVLAAHCRDSADMERPSPEQIANLLGALDAAIVSLKKVLIAIQDP